MDEYITKFLEMQDWPAWVEHGVAILPALLRASAIMLAGWLLSWIVGWGLNRIGRRLSKRDNLEGTVWDFISPIPHFIILTTAFLLALSAFGLETSPLITAYGEPTVRAVLIVVIAWFIAGRISKSISSFGLRLKRGHRRDNTLFAFLATVVRYTMLVIALTVALQQFGSLTSLTAIVGAAAIAVGLALQDTLKAVAGGVMLAAFRPFRLGDWVEIDGHEGEVIDIAPFTTTILGLDNRTIVVPNTQTWGSTIINFTGQEKRRLDMYFDVSYDDDPDHVMAVLDKVFRAHERVLSDEGLWFAVHAFEASSIKMRARAWVRTSDFIQARADLLRAVKYAFDEHDITIPYPQQVEMTPFELEEWKAAKSRPKAPTKQGDSE